MAALQCELCGGKLVGKPGGIFECDSCGMEYSTEWAKAKIQEIKGTVKVEGTVEVTGTVKIDSPIKVEGGINIESLLKRGQMALEDKQWEEASKFFDGALNLNAECAEAYLGKFCASKRWADVHAIIERNGSKIQQDPDFQKGLRFMPLDAAKQLEEELQTAEQRLQEERERQRLRAESEEIAHNNKLNVARKRIISAQGIIAAGTLHVVGLKTKGEVVVTGHDNYCQASGWRNITAVAASGGSTVGLKADGTVIVVGRHKDYPVDVSGWKNITAIAVGSDTVDSHIVGLKKDGTVVAVCAGSPKERCAVSGWRNIVAIAAGASHTVGLKTSGTVVAVGNNQHKQCDVSGWRNIVAIAAGGSYTLGLKADGTVVSTGLKYSVQSDVEGWKNIVSIAANGQVLLGLKADGTVVALSSTGILSYEYDGMSRWKSIVALSVGDRGAVGVKADGTVDIAFGNSSSWYKVNDWKLFKDIDTLEQERKDAIRLAAECYAKERAESKIVLEREKSTLTTELTNLKGIFTGKRRKEIEARLVELETELKNL